MAELVVTGYVPLRTTDECFVGGVVVSDVRVLRSLHVDSVNRSMARDLRSPFWCRLRVGTARS